MKARFSPKRKTPAFYVALLAVVVALMFMLKQCSSRSVFHSVEASPSGGDTIDVAVEYSPLLLYRYDDTIGGLNYDMIRLIASREGLTLKFHPVTAIPEALDGLDKGLYDIVIGDLAGTAYFQERYIVTEPVYIDRQVLVQINDSNMVRSTLDLGGMDVWVPANASVINRLSNLSAEIGDSIMVHEDAEYGAEQLVMLVATGEIERAVVNETVAQAVGADYPQLDVGTRVSFSQFQPWILNKNDSVLAQRLDTAIVHFKLTPEYKELLRRYSLR